MVGSIPSSEGFGQQSPGHHTVENARRGADEGTRRHIRRVVTLRQRTAQGTSAGEEGVLVHHRFTKDTTTTLLVTTSCLGVLWLFFMRIWA
jgi:hypothetical protein